MTSEDKNNLHANKYRDLDAKMLAVLQENEQLKSTNISLNLELTDTKDKLRMKENEIKAKSVKLDKFQSSLESKKQNISALERELQVTKKVKVQDKLENRDHLEELNIKLQDRNRENEALIIKLKEIKNLKALTTRQKREINKLKLRNEERVKSAAKVKQDQLIGPKTPTIPDATSTSTIADPISTSTILNPTWSQVLTQGKPAKTSTAGNLSTIPVLIGAKRQDLHHAAADNNTPRTAGVDQKTSLILTGDSTCRNMGSLLQDRGIDGMAIVHRQADTTRGNNHIKEDCHLFPSNAKGKVLVASYGTNDIMTSQYSQVWKISRMIESVDNHVNDIKVGLLAIPPQVNPAINKRIAETNNFIKTKCDQSINVHYIDCNLCSSDIGRDGIHPNEAGRRKIATTIKDFCHFV